LRERQTKGRPKPLDSKPGLTSFPSAAFWEDPWEPHFDLVALREKAGSLDAVSRLASKLQPGIKLPGLNREKIARLVDSLALEKGKAEELTEDICLLARWYSLPELARLIRVGPAAVIDQLRQAGRHAESLQTLLGGIAPEAEQLAEDLTVDLPVVTDHRSLMSFADDAGQFASAARAIVKHLRPQGRPREYRRNLAIVLACQAVEQATGQRVTTGRQSADATGERFTNAAGHLLAAVIKMLTRLDERVVAGAFVDLRRGLPE
jgi:hypothetical protein